MRTRTPRLGRPDRHLTTNRSVLTRRQATTTDRTNLIPAQIASLARHANDILAALLKAAIAPNIMAGAEAGRDEAPFSLACTRERRGQPRQQKLISLNVPSNDAPAHSGMPHPIGHIACSLIEKVVMA